MSREMMNSAEVAEYLGMSKNHVYQLVRGRKIPFARPGGKLLIFPRRLIDEWIEWNARSNFEPTSEDPGSRAKKNIHALAGRRSVVAGRRKR